MYTEYIEAFGLEGPLTHVIWISMNLDFLKKVFINIYPLIIKKKAVQIKTVL